MTYSWLQKYPVLVVHTNSPNPTDPKEFTLEDGLKNMRFRCADSPVSCGRKADSHQKVFAFKKYPDSCRRGLVPIKVMAETFIGRVCLT